MVSVQENVINLFIQMLQSMNSRLGDHINIFNKFIYFFLRNVLFTKIVNDSDQPPIPEFIFISFPLVVTPCREPPRVQV